MSASVQARAAFSRALKKSLLRQTATEYSRRSVSPRRRESIEYMSVQKAQPFSCEVRILIRCNSCCSMLRSLVMASRVIIALIALGDAE
ncbi:hypothetical protein D3C85_1619420 [compost metagenome]